MKILHINTNDISGGAARATYRLHNALLKKGIESILVVQNKESDDYTIIDLANNKLQKIINYIRPTLDQLFSKFYKNKILFSPAWIKNKKILKIIKEIDPDIVHLHWINGGIIKIENLKKIEKPLVWTLRDMWAFTGGCHYDEECGRYKNRCGKCKILNSNKERDLSRWIWNRKNKVYKKLNNLTIIGLSKWILKCSQESSLLKNKKHINLPNLINTDIFKPLDTEKSREILNLPKNKKLILFGAINPTDDPRKGFKKLIETLDILNLKDIELVVFGSSKPKIPPNLIYNTNYIGKLNDDIALVVLYNAVDLIIVPSLQENLSNVIMESLSCGTPVVAFNIGGNGDMIEHKKNGYLAKPFETEDLSKGIEWILSLDKNEYKKLCSNARQKILSEFDSKVVVKKYINLYEKILNLKD